MEVVKNSLLDKLSINFLNMLKNNGIDPESVVSRNNKGYFYSDDNDGLIITINHDIDFSDFQLLTMNDMPFFLIIKKNLIINEKQINILGWEKSLCVDGNIIVVSDKKIGTDDLEDILDPIPGLSYGGTYSINNLNIIETTNADITKLLENNMYRKKLELMSQDEFVEYLIYNTKKYIERTHNGTVLQSGKPMLSSIYSTIVRRPVYRGMIDSEFELMIENQMNRINNYFIDRENSLKDWKKDDNFSFDGSWDRWVIGKDTWHSETTPKGYITFKNEFDDLTPDLLTKIVKILSESGFNGQVKSIHAKLYNFGRFDDLVIHGRTKESVKKAIDVIKKVVLEEGKSIDYISYGEDKKDDKGEKRSHSELLGIKVKKEILRLHKTGYYN